MLILNNQNGCMDFRSEKTYKSNVCDAFRIEKIIRSLENTDSGERFEVRVNDHNYENYSFIVPSTIVSCSTGELSKEFAAHRLVIPVYYENAASHYIINQYMICKQQRYFEYTHSRLGWYDYDGEKVFLYKENNVKGKKSTTTRKDFAFQKGDAKAYKEFLKQRIYSNPTLSLGMALGYSAVVLSYLKDITIRVFAMEEGVLFSEVFVLTSLFCAVVVISYFLLNQINSFSFAENLVCAESIAFRVCSNTFVKVCVAHKSDIFSDDFFHKVAEFNFPALCDILDKFCFGIAQSENTCVTIWVFYNSYKQFIEKRIVRFDPVIKALNKMSVGHNH